MITYNATNYSLSLNNECDFKQFLLSLSGTARAFRKSFYGQGSGKIFMDDVACKGNESSIVDCNHAGFGVHNCDHSNDAGVSCGTGIEQEHA